MLCSKVSNARLLNGDLRSSKRSESQQSRITLTRRVISWKLALIFSPALGVEPVEKKRKTLDRDKLLNESVLRASFFFRKPLETESLAEFKPLIDTLSCR